MAGDHRCHSSDAMTPLTVTHSRSGTLSWVAPSDIAEWVNRKTVLDRARRGEAEALADLRDGALKLSSLMLDGKWLIKEGVLIGAKP